MSEQNIAVPTDAIVAVSPRPEPNLVPPKAGEQLPPRIETGINELSQACGLSIREALQAGWRPTGLTGETADSARHTINSLAAQDQAKVPDQYPHAAFDGHRYVCYAGDGTEITGDAYIEDSITTLKAIADSPDDKIPQATKDTARTQAAQLEQYAAQEKAKIRPATPEQAAEAEAADVQKLYRGMFGIRENLIPEDEQKLTNLNEQLAQKKISQVDYDKQLDALGLREKPADEAAKLESFRKRREAAIGLVHHLAPELKGKLPPGASPDELRGFALKLMGTEGAADKKNLIAKLGEVNFWNLLFGILLAAELPATAASKVMEGAQG